MIALNPAERPSFEEIMKSKWLNRSINEESVLEQMTSYIQIMNKEKEIIKQKVDSRNRDKSEISIFDQLDETELIALKFEKVEFEDQNIKKGFIFNTKNKEILAKIVLKIVADFREKRVENKNNKLILSFEKSPNAVE